MKKNCGFKVLKHKSSNKIWTLEQKYELIAKEIAGTSWADITLKAGINPGMVD